MKKQNLILSAALAAVFSASTAFAEAEVTGKIVHESGFFSEAGTTIGADSATLNTTWTSVSNAHKKNDAMKRETSARIYIDGDAEELQEGATYHVELNLMTDSKGVAKHDSNDSYTQRDALREAYIDTEYENWSIRAGKQQVVWGTADGMKLLDMINPTDYSEMAQNQMEDSRIPVWMLNAEKTQEDGSEIQVVISQPKENVFAGLDRNIDTSIRGNNLNFTDETNSSHSQGHAFMMKGVDSIVGEKDGMLDIVPDLGGIARRFAWGFGKIGSLDDGRMSGFTVSGFEGMTMGGGNVATNMAFAMGNVAPANGGNMLCITADAGTGTCTAGVTNDDYDGSTGGWDYTDLPDNFQGAILGVAKQLNGISGSAGSYTDADGNNVADSVVDGYANATTGQQMLAYGFQPYYNTNLADMDSVDDATFDFMGNANFKTFNTFVNAQSQYAYDMPSDSDVDLALRYKNSTSNGINYSLNASYNYDKNPIINLSWHGTDGAELTQSSDAYGAIVLKDASDVEYGGTTGNRATLRFTETVKRAKNIGGSFDTAIETEELGPVVIRGEFLYSKDVYSPVMDKVALGKGDMLGALTMVKGDRAKFVLGADITALTNMMVSAQFIQDSNLDFIDGDQATGKYTADYATMSLYNGFNKGTKDKNFYSLFLSKPFGASGEHRWNNIFMFEENGGKWNRLDAEFSIDDDTQATVEYNKYWGDANTQFGQLEKSSNIQVGFKYSF